MSNEEPEVTPVAPSSGDVSVPQSPASSEPGGEGRSSSKLSTAIIVLTTILAILSVFSVWARTQLLDTDEWVDLSADLVERPEVQDAVAAYLVEQVYADGKVATGLEELLPEDLSGLAGPLAGVIRGHSPAVSRNSSPRGVPGPLGRRQSDSALEARQPAARRGRRRAGHVRW